MVIARGRVLVGVVICRSELAREGRFPVATVFRIDLAPLPNPLPEGRGDRWAGLGVLALAGNAKGFRLKPFRLSARTSPLSLQGEGWGEGKAASQYTEVAGKRPSRASSLLRKAEKRKSGKAEKRKSGKAGKCIGRCMGLAHRGRSPLLHPPASTSPSRMRLSGAIPITATAWVSQAQPILRKAPRRGDGPQDGSAASLCWRRRRSRSATQ